VDVAFSQVVRVDDESGVGEQLHSQTNAPRNSRRLPGIAPTPDFYKQQRIML
jgi:hypothetical protein